MLSLLMSNQLLRSNHGDEYTIAEQNQVKWTFDDGPRVRFILLVIATAISVTCFYYSCNNSRIWLLMEECLKMQVLSCHV